MVATKVDPAEMAVSAVDKYALPIVPHELTGGVDCCGCLIVHERGAEADLTCNECGAIVRTVPLAQVEQELPRMAMSGGICSSKCQHCGALQTFPALIRLRHSSVANAARETELRLASSS
jgi:hypothetical protein